MITKQQIIDKLNDLTDDPDEEIRVLTDNTVLEIYDIGLESYDDWDATDIKGKNTIICLDANEWLQDEED